MPISTGIYASSVGGGGGNGGYATSVAVSFTAPAATPSAAVALAVGGTGGGGGNGGAVTVNNYSSVTTQGDNSSFAILAQSIGGGGGAGGNALTVTDVIGGPNENASVCQCWRKGRGRREWGRRQRDQLCRPLDARNLLRRDRGPVDRWRWGNRRPRRGVFGAASHSNKQKRRGRCRRRWRRRRWRRRGCSNGG